MRPLVIVRPQPGAESTARAARDAGLDPIVLPLFAIEPVEWEAPERSGFDALLLTSANAVRFGGGELEGLRASLAYCVGEATAAAARNAGFAVAGVGNGGVDALLDSIPAGVRLLHLCGADRREPRSPKQAIAHLAVYRSVELPPPGDLHPIEKAVVMVHSPRSAARVRRLAEERGIDRGTASIAAISPEAADAAGAGWEAVEIAAAPSDSELLSLAVRLCNNPASL